MMSTLPSPSKSEAGCQFGELFEVPKFRAMIAASTMSTLP